MVGSGERQKMTDFTIDCILSKSDRTERRALPLNQPMTLNKVLNNNPWIPISPLAHFFNPSSLHKKFSLPNLFCHSTTPIGTNIIENLIRVTENHTQTVHNHFYASPHVLAFEGSPSPLPPKSIVYEKIFCDTSHDESLRHNSHNDLVDKSPCTPPLSLNGGAIENKCVSCSKSFENSELLDVSYLKIKK
jgi:hypothetical protein